MRNQHSRKPGFESQSAIEASLACIQYTLPNTPIHIPISHVGRSQELAITWDFDNRMITADVENDSSIEDQHKYDALGRRVARTEDMTTVVFVQFGQQTICDYPVGADPALSIYRYLYASYIDEPVMRWETGEDEPVYYHRNQQYSIVAVTDDNGDILERYSYSAYGVPTFFTGAGTLLSGSSYGNCYTYTCREYDSVIRIYHFRARLYDPQLGKFLSRDPMRFGGGYKFYKNYFDLRMADPSGLKCTDFSFGLDENVFRSGHDNPNIWHGMRRILGKLLPCELDVRSTIGCRGKRCKTGCCSGQSSDGEYGITGDACLSDFADQTTLLGPNRIFVKRNGVADSIFSLTRTVHGDAVL